MPKWTGAADITTNNLPNLGGAGEQAYRVSNAVTTYLSGTVLQLVPIDSQVYPDFQTVQISPAAANGTKIVGVVTDGWAGFDNQGAGGLPVASYTSASSQTNIRGTQFIQAKVKGVNYIRLDASGGVTVVDGTPLATSANTAGYAQGETVANADIAGNLIGYANLPSSTSIPGYTLTHGTLAQAAAVFTVATPAAGDTVNTIIQTPFTDLAPGTVQKTTWSLTLTTAAAVSATTAGAAIVAYLNAQPSFSQWFTATNSAGAVTVTVNALSNPWLVTGGTTNSAGTAMEQYRFFVGLSGVTANLLTTAGSVTGSGGTTYSAGATTFGGGTAGTGYLGICPAIILGMY